MADFTDDTLGEKVGQSPAAHSVILRAVRPSLGKFLIKIVIPTPLYICNVSHIIWPLVNLAPLDSEPMVLWLLGRLYPWVIVHMGDWPHER